MTTGDTDNPTGRRRWPWVISAFALVAVGCYVAFAGLVAPWTGAPESVSLALSVGGCALAVIGLMGVRAGFAGDGGRPWLGRWLCCAAAVAVVVVVGYSADSDRVLGGQGVADDVLVCLGSDATSDDLDRAVERFFRIGESARAPVRSFLLRDRENAYSFDWSNGASEDAKAAFLDEVGQDPLVHEVRLDAFDCPATP